MVRSRGHLDSEETNEAAWVATRGAVTGAARVSRVHLFASRDTFRTEETKMNKYHGAAYQKRRKSGNDDKIRFVHSLQGARYDFVNI